MGLCAAKPAVNDRTMCTVRAVPLSIRNLYVTICEHQLYGKFPAVMNSEQASPRRCKSRLVSGRLPAMLRNQNNFSRCAWFQDSFMGARGFRERQLFAYHGAQRAVFKTGDEAGMNFGFFRGSDGPEREAASGGPT